MRTRLLCAFMLGASALAVPALALPANTQTFTVQSEVPAYCSELQVSAVPMNLGSLAGPTGQIIPNFNSAPEASRELSASFYCNAPSTVTIKADPLINDDATASSDPSSFTNRVDYTAVLKWRDLQGSASSTATAGQVLDAPEPNIGSLTLKVTDPVTNQNRRPVAGNYAGQVHLTITVTQ